ncbi:MAG: YedE-related selenium metabolism membrane protein [Dehalococcoidaceae bacterium]|nr:YedE-related selenium metabolism membrane protein [Dehalococcoidaceae bacterium]
MGMISSLMSKKWIILFGLLFGTLGALAVNWGNPANMGICVACFLRDISGALGFHRAAVVQYLRPEIMGFALGAFVTALAFKEWRPRGGASPIIRFILGMCVMIGALVFLGCPIRMLLRLAGGDLNGLTALAGLIFGVIIGIFFLKRGFNLGKAKPLTNTAGGIMPGMMVVLLVLAIAVPAFIFQSESGPGSQFMPLIASLAIGLFVGFGAQRTRYCSVGAWRDIFLVKDFYLISGILAFLVAALVTNYIAGNFAAGGIYHWGFAEQPVSHADHLWNFLGMGLVGIAATQIGGCPLRNLILSGEGDTDAGVTVLGYIAGAAVAHNFAIAASPAGINTWSIAAVAAGWAFCLIIGFTMRKA